MFNNKPNFENPLLSPPPEIDEDNDAKWIAAISDKLRPKQLYYWNGNHHVPLPGVTYSDDQITIKGNNPDDRITLQRGDDLYASYAVHYDIVITIDRYGDE